MEPIDFLFGPGNSLELPEEIKVRWFIRKELGIIIKSNHMTCINEIVSVLCIYR